MKLKKILCLALAFIFVCAVLCSCGKKDRGILLASYDGGEVYSLDEDVQQWSDYLYGYYYDYIAEGGLDTKQFGDIVVNTVVLHRLEEIDAKEKGIEISEEEIKERFDYNKLNFDEYYEGGFEKLKTDSGLGDDFWMDFARCDLLENAILDEIVVNTDFTKEDLISYFGANYSNYMVKAGYEYSAVFVEVLDTKSDTEWAEKKTVAEGYIARILGGEDFDKIKEEILAKYTLEDGYSNTHYASGDGKVDRSEFVNVTDLDAALASAKEQYPSDEEYLKYLSVCMKYEQCYAMKNLSSGETYSKPIITPVGWMILRLNYYQAESYYPLFDEVSERVAADYLNELMQDDRVLDAYREKLIKKYNVVTEEYTFG